MKVVSDDNCLSTEIDGESVILHMEKGKYYGFNEVGTRVWQIVQQPRTVDEICDELVSIYDVDRTQCRRDVESLIDELNQKGLVHVVNEE